MCFFRGNSRIISDCQVRMKYFKNTSGYLDTIYGANSDRKLTTDRMAIPPSDVPLWFALGLLGPAVAVVAC